MKQSVIDTDIIIKKQIKQANRQECFDTIKPLLSMLATLVIFIAFICVMQS